MDRQQPFLYLSERTLEGLDVSTADVAGSIEALIRGRAAGKAWSAPKAVMQPPDGRFMMAALAAADDPPVLAVKTVVLNPANAERGIPLINGLVTMLDSDTGMPVAVVDGNWVTAVRTAGLSAVAARTMARPASESAAFIGCGVQARSHLKAFSSMFPLREIRAFGRGRPNIDALCELAAELGLVARICNTAKDALSEADIVVSSLTRTPGRVPFLDAREMKTGAFAALTDLADPWLPDSLTAFDRIIIDDLDQEAALDRKLAPPEQIGGDLTGLVLGETVGRSGEDERCAFIFRGHALGDLALAGLALRKAREAGVGTVIDT